MTTHFLGIPKNMIIDGLEFNASRVGLAVPVSFANTSSGYRFTELQTDATSGNHYHQKNTGLFVNSGDRLVTQILVKQAMPIDAEGYVEKITLHQAITTITTSGTSPWVMFNINSGAIVAEGNWPTDADPISYVASVASDAFICGFAFTVIGSGAAVNRVWITNSINRNAYDASGVERVYVANQVVTLDHNYPVPFIDVESGTTGRGMWFNIDREPQSKNENSMIQSQNITASGVYSRRVYGTNRVRKLRFSSAPMDAHAMVDSFTESGDPVVYAKSQAASVNTFTVTSKIKGVRSDPFNSDLDITITEVG